MRKINFSLISYGFLIAVLAGCGGGKTASSPGEVVVVTPNQQQVLGYWTPSNSTNYSYEFYSGPTEAPYDNTLHTGRILQGAVPVNPFYWTIQLDGTITLSVVSPDCMARPLNLCQVLSTETIVASGNSVQDASWTIASDKNSDRVIEKKVTDTYHRADIDLSGVAQGDIFLTHSNNKIFDTPIKGNVADGKMSIRLDDFDKPIVVSAPSYSGNKKDVQFTSNEDSAITVDQEFLVAGSGYVKIPVKKWFENVALSGSVGGDYVLNYEMHKKVQIPPEIDASLVQLGNTELVQRKSAVVGTLDKFIAGVPIKALDKFYLSLELDFKKATAGNLLRFTSETEGVLSVTFPHHQEAPAEVRNFNWTQDADGTIVLHFPNYGDVTVRFIQSINGGYQVLYTHPDKHYGTTYRVRDLVQDGPPALTEQFIPGRYLFTSISPLPNGSHVYNLTFHKDKTVTGQVAGYWFQDVNGDIVSYECTYPSGQTIPNYAECAAALDDRKSVTFAHVRRARFMHKDGNNYQAQYTGSVYGPPFTAAAAENFSTFALTYRWVRVGDELPASTD